MLAWTRKDKNAAAHGDPDADNVMMDVQHFFSPHDHVQVTAGEIELPMDPKKKIQLIQETVHWWHKNDPTNPPLPSEVEQLEITLDVVPLLQVWWDEKGKDYATRNGLFPSDQIGDVARKLKAAQRWLENNLHSSPVAKDDNPLTTAMDWVAGGALGNGNGPDGYSGVEKARHEVHWTQPNS